MTSQRIGKYACLEVEARYLLTRVPDGLLNQPKGWHITDHYFPETRLRLRHMKSLSGDEEIYKIPRSIAPNLKAHTKPPSPMSILPWPNFSSSQP